LLTSRISTSSTISAFGLSLASMIRSMIATWDEVPRTVIVLEFLPPAAICGTGRLVWTVGRATVFSSVTISAASAFDR